MDLAPLIPIVGTLSGLGFVWIAFRYKQLQVESRTAERIAAMHADEKERLERRLAVLERLATDRGIETAEQIEALREADAMTNVR